MVSVIFVETNGPYFNDPRIDPWDLERDAFKFKGPGPVIAHPPCKRWGRYWSGGPSAHGKFLKGDDDNCFAHSLWCVRTFGGVIEHPEASHAWAWFGLNRPNRNGGWTEKDSFGGQSCCVYQGNYGHKGQKATWLYYVGNSPIEMEWGPSKEIKQRMGLGFHSKEERARYLKTGICQRLSKKQRRLTPIEFKELLITLVEDQND